MVVLPDTYDWARWLPNMQEGLENPDDDICADRMRETAIDFARKSWILQREVTVVLQNNESNYPVLPLPNERIVGVIAARSDEGGCSACSGMRGTTPFGVEFTAHERGVHITNPSMCGVEGQKLTLLVYAVPTEDACAHDVMLYDEFRSAITAEARRRYAKAHYYKDRALMQSLPSEADFERAALNAKRRAVKPSAQDQHGQGSGLFNGNTTRFARNYESRFFR